MTANWLARFFSRLALSVTLGALSTALVPQACAAANLVSFYIGGAYGHADVTAPTAELFHSRIISPGGIDLGHAAYQVMLGMRVLPMLGFEIDYLDLGTVSGSPGSFYGSAIRAQITQRGEAAFAVIDLPVPIIKVYLKAGVARLTSEMRGTFAGTTCPAGVACFAQTILPPSQGALSTSPITPALGGGLQWTHGPWGIRAEYERFAAFGAHPDLVSVGVIWTFP
jgi:hypothetical protein